MCKRMSKIASLIITFTVVLSLVLPYASYAYENTDDVESFVNEIIEVVREYDADKDFKSPKKEQQVNFQTCRLIVRSNGGFDTHGAIEDITGFQDYHILQYESEEKAKQAYYSLSECQNVYSVSPDEIIKASDDGADVDDYPITDEFPLSKNGHLCDWATEQTQSSYVVDYINDNNLSKKEIIVAVLDDGVDYNHEFLKDRIIRTHYNAAADGLANDELDTGTDPDYSGHGTAVSSVIIDNSPENVKVANYKVYGDYEVSSLVQVASTIIKIAEDKKSNNCDVDIINLSLGGVDSEFFLKSAVDYAFSENIIIVASAGNEASNLLSRWETPAIYDNVITVGATDKNARISAYSNRGLAVDVSAPGTLINVAYPHNQYRIWSGTSFSCPFISGNIATILSLYPEWSTKRIVDTLKKNAVSVYCYNNGIFDAASLNDWFKEIPNLYGAGMVQLGWLIDDELPAQPVIENLPAIIVNEAVCTLSVDDNSDIYYTLDGTFPNKENGILYTEPFTINADIDLRAISYQKENTVSYGTPIEEYYSCFTLGRDDMFTIDEQGCITSYSGNVHMLALPDTVNGVKVTSFNPQIFNKEGLYGIILSNGIETIPEQAFRNSDLIFINTANAKTVGERAFSGCNNVTTLEIPNVTTAGDYAFYGLSSESLGILNAPALENAGKNALLNTRLQIAYLPKLKEVLNYLPNSTGIARNKILYLYAPELESVKGAIRNFALDASYLEWAYVPKLQNNLLVNGDSAIGYLYAYSLSNIPDKEYPYLKEYNFFSDINFNSFNYDSAYPKIIRNNASETIGEDAFGKYFVERLEIGNLKSAESFPQNIGCVLALSSAFESCNEDTVGRNYKVYGLDGSKAEEWAKANGHTFIPLSQETAIYNDIDSEYYGWGDISFDVIGYNKTYTWYGCNNKNGKDKTELSSENYGKFYPLNYNEYPYYYCVCIIKDKEDTIAVRSSVCKNLDISSANYINYDEAVARANEVISNKNNYKDVSELETLLSEDVSGLSCLEQSTVDDLTNQINEAIESLVYKPADYTELDRLLSAVPTDLSLYTDESVEKLNTVIGEINRELPIIQQDEVDQYCTDLASAINGLIYKDANYTEYNSAAEKANALDRNEYKDFSAVDEALSKDVSGKSIVEQTAVDEQTQAILKAIEALEKKDVAYEIIKGANSTFDISKDTELVIASNADFEKFVAVLVDDVELDKNAYSAKAGSTVITLKADYLKTLALAEHSIVITSTDGFASTVFTVVKSNAEESTTKPEETTSPSTTKPSESTDQSTAKIQDETTTIKRDNSLISPKTGNNFPSSLVYVVVLSYLTVGLLFVKKRKQKIN